MDRLVVQGVEVYALNGMGQATDQPVHLGMPDVGNGDVVPDPGRTKFFTLPPSGHSVIGGDATDSSCG
jgi:hypothetical protein